MEEGIVIKSTGNLYLVRMINGNTLTARIKGSFRMMDIKTTNPVAVGDKVIVSDVATDPVISKIKPRTNYIIRKSVNLSKQAHIIAANLDQAILITTIAQPETSTGFIDRFLITAEAYHIPTTIVFNKTDIYTKKDMEKLHFLIETYTKIGYECMAISVTTNKNIDQLIAKLKNKTSLVSGHSGVGKSSLLNLIEPSLQLKTSIISDAHQLGKHTTTFAEMHELSFGGFVVDTPGIKAFGLIDLDKTELSHYFIEMRELLSECQFNNCQHINEPKCAVKKAVENNEIASFRYQNYLSMYDDNESESYRGKGY